MIVHGTRVFRDRVPGRAAAPDEVSTTALGAWYATLLRWRRPVALLVNEPTLLPLLMPLAPARTLLARIPGAVADLLAAHGLPTPFIDAERAAMGEVRLAPTANRSVVGVLNEFTSLADIYRADVRRSDTYRADGGGLLELSLRLAGTPLGPLYQRHVSPDRELAALVAERTQSPDYERTRFYRLQPPAATTATNRPHRPPHPRPLTPSRTTNGTTLVVRGCVPTITGTAD